jgi:hypothetical protein
LENISVAGQTITRTNDPALKLAVSGNAAPFEVMTSNSP